MICRVVMFQWKENSKEVAEACADQMVKRISDTEGCKGVTFVGQYDHDIYGTSILWESEQAADNAAEAIRSCVLELAGENILAVIESKQYDVYVPNS
jgi:hypothetical protein